MTFVLGARSLQRLAGVHPHLVDTVKGAIAVSEVDFAVIEGVRSIDRQVELYSQGRTTAQMRAAGIVDVEGKPHEKKVTWTLNSNHFVRNSGFGHAVDLAPFVGGKIVWEPWGLFQQIAKAMKEAAAEMNYPVTWGGDWKKPDGPHFELPRDYPA